MAAGKIGIYGSILHMMHVFARILHIERKIWVSQPGGG
jgi:hypothetical protein